MAGGARGMLPYLTLAAAIVLGVTIAVAGWARRDALRLKIASVYASAAPKAQPTNKPEQGSGRPLRGDAPWALSALPDCVLQLSRTTGSAAFVREHVPSAAVVVTPPASLHVGACTIVVRGNGIEVHRGTDRLRIPSPARLYRAPGRLAVLREGSGGNDLRIYEPTPH